MSNGLLVLSSDAKRIKRHGPFHINCSFHFSGLPGGCVSKKIPAEGEFTESIFQVLGYEKQTVSTELQKQESDTVSFSQSWSSSIIPLVRLEDVFHRRVLQNTRLYSLSFRF